MPGVIGAQLPGCIDIQDVRIRHSAMVATMLRQLGDNYGFGSLRWHSVTAIADWPDHARKFVARVMQPIIQGE